MGEEPQACKSHILKCVNWQEAIDGRNLAL